MPSTSKKQHNFMAAIANNPSFAKKVGIPQSVGKDFSAADKGRKFQKGGATMMGKKIPNAMADMMARRRPRMGAGMAPSAPPAPMGMKKGGKVRRFEEGGVTQGQNPEIDDATRARARAFVAKNEPPTTNYSDEAAGGGESRTFTADKRPSTPKSLASRFNQGDARNAEPKTSQAAQTAKPIPANETNTGAVTGRVDKVSKNMPSAAQKEENTERLGEGMLTAASLIPAGRLAKGAYTLNAERMRRADVLSSTAERKARFANRRSAANAKEAAYDARRSSDMEAGFNKGGNVKESKAMVNKEMMFMKKKGAPASMIKHEKAEMGMKKGGMPMKDGKPAFMMGKKMNMGGMAKYAKGGGIESRGKTKGTIIRMAAGGSVGSASRRADGIAQRGKTKFTNY